MIATVLFIPVLLLESHSFQTRLAKGVLHSVSENLSGDFRIDSLAISPSRMCVEVYGLSASDSLSRPILNVRRIDGSIRLFRFLLHKEIVVNNIHITGLDLHLTKDSLDAPLNISYLFAAEKKEKEGKPLDINANLRSLMILDGHVTYDVLSEPRLETTDPNHLSASVSTQMSVNLLMSSFTDSISGDSIGKNLHAKIHLNKFSFKEQHGFSIDRIRLVASVDNDSVFVKGMEVEMPHSKLQLNSFSFVGPLKQGRLINTATLRAEISPSDLPTAQKMYREAELPLSPLTLLASANGDVQKANVSMSISSGELLGIDGWCQTTGLFSNDLHVISRWKQLKVNTDIARLVSELVPTLSLPPMVDAVGFVNYNGEIMLTDGHPLLNGTLSTGLGDIVMKANLQPADSLKKLTAELSFKDLAVGQLGLDFLTGPASLQASVNGILPQKGVPLKAFATVHIDHASVLSYDYRNLRVDASANGNVYKAFFKADDPNLQCALNAIFDRSQPKPEIEVGLELPHASLHNLHVMESSDGKSDLAFNLNAKVRGSSLQEMISALHLEISRMSLLHNASPFTMERLTVVSGMIDNNTYLQVSSPILSCRIIGTGTCLDMVGNICDGIVHHYLPALAIGKKWEPTEDLYQFNLRLRNSQPLFRALGLPVSVETLADLDGTYNNQTGLFRLSLESSDISMSGNRLLLPALHIENSKDSSSILLHAQSGLLNNGTRSDIAVDVAIHKDSIDLSAFWNQLAISEKGNINVSLAIDRDGKDEHLSSRIHLDSPHILVAGEDWTIEPSEIHIFPDRFDVRSLSIHSGDKFLKANGPISKNMTDTLFFDLKGISLDDIFALLPAKEKDPFTLGGIATAKGRAAGLLGTPKIEGIVSVDGFAIKKRLLGDLNAHSWWNENDKCIRLDGNFSNDSLDICQVDGSFTPATKTMSLDVRTNGLPIDFVSTFLEPTLTLGGPVYGDVGVNILFRDITEILLDGSPHLKGEVGVTPIGAKFLIDDIIVLQPQQITFNNVGLKDYEGHSGTLYGNLKHHSFKDIQFNMGIDMNSLRAMNLPESDTETMYGNVLASGKVAITGNDKDIHIDVNARTENPSTFTFALGGVSVNDYEFITFTDHNVVDTVTASSTEIRKETIKKGSLKLNLQIDVTDDTEVNLKLGQSIGDGLKGRGNGKIRIEYDPAGDLGIFGDYELRSGLFEFQYKNLLRRNFTIEQGSDIRFAGDPLKAQMGVTASYHVIGASLSGLLSESDLNALNLTRQTIPVDCMLGLTGELQQPQINMDLAFPNADPELKRRILSVINTEEALSRQLVYLLLLNSFAPTENSQIGNTASSNMNAVWGATLNGLTSQLNQVLFDALGTDKFSFGFNYNNDLNTGTNEWQVAMTGNLLDNRLKINGNVGQRDNLVTNATNQFIGDFDLEYKLTQRLRLKAYSHSNDSRYFKSATTTQGLGIVVKDSFNSLSQLWHNWVESFNRQKVRSKSYSDLLPKENQ